MRVLLAATGLTFGFTSPHLRAADNVDWPNPGNDKAGARYAAVDQINRENVKRLTVAWTYNTGDAGTGTTIECTPLVVDGVMYVTASWSIVHAIDVRSGKRLWTYDPQVPREGGYKGCCDVANRGVALYQGRVFVAPMTAG